jgi:uncharacterized membrane protein
MRADPPNNRSLAHEAFEIGIVLKGLDGIVQLVGAVLLLAVPPGGLRRAVAFLTQHVLSEDPNDFIASHLFHMVQQLTASAQLFAAVYLLVHGALRVGLVWALWRAKLWAYPVAIAVFAAFAAYQIYRYSLSRSTVMLVLTILDAIVIALTWIEYRQRRGLRATHDPPRSR